MGLNNVKNDKVKIRTILWSGKTLSEWEKHFIEEIRNKDFIDKWRWRL